MIIKKITVDNENYLIGLRMFDSSSGDAVECCIFKKFLLWKNTIYKSISLKGSNPDYKQIAINTILDYKKECEERNRLISDNWN